MGDQLSKELLSAVYEYDVKKVKTCIENGADVNVKDEGGWSPLHYASNRGYNDLTKYLISKGAIVNMTDNHGDTPLHRASKSGRGGIAKILIENGADVTIKNNRGQTARDLANELCRNNILVIIDDSSKLQNNEIDEKEIITSMEVENKSTNIINNTMTNKKIAPISFTELLQLTSLGIQEQSITYKNVTLQSSKYVTVREEGKNNLAIIDIATKNVLRLPVQVDSAIMNPISKVVALRAGVDLQIYNLDMKSKMKAAEVQNVVFWKWINPRTIAIVNDKSVFHWSMDGDAKPVKKFDRVAYDSQVQVLNYSSDTTGKWLLLNGFAKGKNGGIEGVLQVFSVEHNASLPTIPSHAACFAQVTLDGRDKPANLLCFTRKVKTRIGKLNCFEVGAPRESAFKQSVNIKFQGADFPVSMIPDNNHGVLFVISKGGVLFVYDIYSGKCIFIRRASRFTMFTSCPHENGGVVTIDQSGCVSHFTIEDIRQSAGTDNNINKVITSMEVENKSTNIINNTMTNKKIAPISFTELLQLTSLGIQEQSITYKNVTLQSSKYVTVREEGKNNLAIIDIATKNVLRLPVQVDSAIMNPISKVVALRAGANLQIYNLDMKSKMKTAEVQNVVFWKWINPKTIAIVNDKSVFHWSMDGDAKPVKKFERAAYDGQVQVLNYSSDITGKWLLLNGIAKGKNGGIEGVLQVFSVEHNASQPTMPSHAACIAQVTLDGRDKPANLLCFTRKGQNGDDKLNIIEVGAPRESAFKQSVNIKFQGADFPVSMIPDNNHGVLFVISKGGVLFVNDIYSGKCIFIRRVSRFTMFTSCPHENGGVVTIDQSGCVSHFTIEDIRQSAGKDNNINKVKDFVQSGGDINQTDALGATALHHASYYGRYEIVEYLISKRANINMKNNWGVTPVHWACFNGKDKLVELLIANGANVTIKDIDGKTSRDIAQQFGHNNIVQLIDNSLSSQNNQIEDKNDKDIITLEQRATLMTEAFFNEEDAETKSTELLSPVNSDIKMTDRELMKAVILNNINDAKDCIEKGANVNMNDAGGSTPLHCASENGRSKIAKYLISNGANVNVKNKSGSTPLHVASFHGKDKVVELLITNGADVTIRNNFGETARGWAIEFGHSNIVELIDNSLKSQNNQIDVKTNNEIIIQNKAVVLEKKSNNNKTDFAAYLTDNYITNDSDRASQYKEIITNSNGINLYSNEDTKLDDATEFIMVAAESERNRKAKEAGKAERERKEASNNILNLAKKVLINASDKSQIDHENMQKLQMKLNKQLNIMTNDTNKKRIRLNEAMKLPNRQLIKKINWAIQSYYQLQQDIECSSDEERRNNVKKDRDNVKSWLTNAIKVVKDSSETVTSHLNCINGLDNRVNSLIHHHQTIQKKVMHIIDMIGGEYPVVVKNNYELSDEKSKEEEKKIFLKSLRSGELSNNINNNYHIINSCWYDKIKECYNKVNDWPNQVTPLFEEIEAQHRNYCDEVNSALCDFGNLFDSNMIENRKKNIQNTETLINDRWSKLKDVIFTLNNSINDRSNLLNDIWLNTSPIEDIKNIFVNMYIEIKDSISILMQVRDMWQHKSKFINELLESDQIKDEIKMICKQFDDEYKKIKKAHKRARRDLEDAEEDDEPTDELKVKVSQLDDQKVLKLKSFHKSLLSYINIVRHHCPELIYDTSDKSLKRLQEMINSEGLDKYDLSLESFHNIQLISNANVSASRHSVFKATLGDEIYALKRFDVDKRNRLLKEAKTLKLLAHPYIVEVCGIIPDTLNVERSTAVYLQMPYYEYRSLAKFISSSSSDNNNNINNISTNKANHIRILMKQVALGLEHIHKKGIVHCDIKPNNIFLEDEYHIRIGDFDVSKTSKEGMTIAMAVGYASTVVGFTADYAAPECLNNTTNNVQITCASDIYSFGLVLYDLHFGYNNNHRPSVANNWKLILNRDINPLLADLLKKILVINPKQRLTISDVVRHEYFSANDVDLIKKYKEEEEKRLGNEYECCLCFETYYEIEGVLCANNRHFLCNGCFEAKVINDSNDMNGLLQRRGLIYCPYKTMKGVDACDATEYSDQIIASHIDELVFDAYMKSRKEVLESELSKKYESKLEEEKKKWMNTNERERRIRQAVNHIVDNILTLRCQNPNGCGQAIFDFTDCFAVTCNRCHTQFCAWCLKWCNADAHQHVRQCPKSKNPGSVFSTMAQFNEVHRQSNQMKTNEYLSTLSADIVVEVANRIAPHLV